jgi:hypothetical protein
VVTVRKIEPEHIYAGFYKLQQFFVRIAGGAYGGYNLGTVKGVIDTGSFIHLAMAVFLNIVFHNAHYPVREFLPAF